MSTFSKCSNSCLVDSGVDNSVLALWVRVLIILYLEAKLWLHQSGLVSYITFVVKVPSASGIISRFKNGKEPSGPVSSMVNLMDVSTWLI